MQTPHQQFDCVPINPDPRRSIARALRMISEYIDREMIIKTRYFSDANHVEAKVDILASLGFEPNGNDFEKFADQLISRTKHDFSSAWFNECRQQVPRPGEMYCPYVALLGVNWFAAKSVAESQLAIMDVRPYFRPTDDSTAAELGQFLRTLSDTAVDKFFFRCLRDNDQILVIESESDLEGWLRGIGGIGLVAEKLMESEHELALLLNPFD